MPEESLEALAGRERISFVLEHQEPGGGKTRKVFETVLREDIEWQFTEIEWPGDVRAGVLVSVSWHAQKQEVVARTTSLEEPVRVDGVDFFHEYDPKVVTREFEAGKSNRGQVMFAVRRQGRIFPDGSAVLDEATLPAQTKSLGRGAKGTFFRDQAVEQLIREGYLTRVPGSVDAHGYPSYPAVEGQKEAEMLFYAPMLEEVPDPEDPDAQERRDHWVNGFVRKLPPGAQPSEKQLELHERAVESAQLDDSPLAPGYTFVKKHHRT
ncbi:hypothetical protein [Winogradskya humida]|uniref:Uncharacterized protein n=1 Tax=Winogradskya humida TaxID=113566 RepID=A0ABQ3ZUB9_9ACTN|nr:hypothetical protein [Actinoplanes humidus]GIE22202.1 hypothetical protein Ahu01nite_053040 [Actinoplanes humidus]